MGQKINPLSFRLGINKLHHSSWFARPQSYTSILQEDKKIRDYVLTRLVKASISRVQINRQFNQVELQLYTSRPGVIIGRSGAGIDFLKRSVKNLLVQKSQLKINIIDVTNPDMDAVLLACFISQQLENRTTFKRVVRQAMQRAQKNEIQGIKIQVSGRLNGAEIARTEWIREGRVPLQTLKADLDYATSSAYTSYGVIGVKVWIFKGEAKSWK
nr:ribosomal protein S3 [Cyanidiaceae sp.]